jgi:dUTP pyrophosphatase
MAVVRLDRDLPMPSRAHDGDAGIDLFSAVDVELAPGHRALVPTGIAVAVPYGMVGLIHPRSGLAARVGLSIVNSPGTVDAGYRGEIPLHPSSCIVAIGSPSCWCSGWNYPNWSR